MLRQKPTKLMRVDERKKSAVFHIGKANESQRLILFFKLFQRADVC
jgi:hypothetical protein